MPGHSSKKQSQRTKGNLRPSSSSQAAELIATTGGAASGFIGFGQSPKYVPVSSSLDDVDSSLDSDFRLVLRKLTKKDATTKIKALQELSDLCKEKSEDGIKAILPFWPRMYNKMALDVDHRVRETNQQAMSTLVVRARRNLAPYLRNLMGAWLLSQCDTYPTVASAAVTSFSDAFPPAKQTEALVFCRESALEYLIENLVVHTQQTLSDPKTTEPEDMENKYNRVLAASLLAIRKLLVSLPANQMESCKEQLTSLLENNKFWKHGKSKVSAVRGAMYSLFAGLCQMLPDLSAQYAGKITPLVLHNLDEDDPGVLPYLWEAVLSLVNYVQDCWTHVNVQKAFWPKLKKVLESACHGNAVVVAPNLLPLTSKIPADLFPDNARFYEDFFTCFRTGLCQSSVKKSASECKALVRAYLECAQLVVTRNTESNIVSSVLLDQVLPVVQASLFEGHSLIHKSALYGMMGTLLTSVEATDNTTMQRSAAQFWSQLQESVDQRLFSDEESNRGGSSDVKSNKGDNFDEKIVLLVKCLFSPQTEVRQQRTGNKVMFEVPEDVTMKVRKVQISGANTPKPSPKPETKITLGKSCKHFVHYLILKSFEMAHKDMNSNHLRIFAQLLELDPDEELISKIIGQCHGDVAMETQTSEGEGVTTGTTSHYFVFNICIPWLQKVQMGRDFVEEFGHLVNVACIFLSVLDSQSTTQLLHTLYESCSDTLCQFVLLRKLFSQALSSKVVADWLRSSQFADSLVTYFETVCRKPVNMTWEADTTNILDILSLVLSSRDEKNELIVQKCYIEKLFSVLKQPVHNLAVDSAVPNRAELAIGFVARAAKCFFSQYTECLITESATDLIVTLFQISLRNPGQVSDVVLEVAHEAWCTGIQESVQLTGGLLSDTSALCKLAACVRETVVSLTGLEGLATTIDCVRRLLTTLGQSLPDGTDNIVCRKYCRLLMVSADLSIPNCVWNYMCTKGSYLCCDVPKVGDSTALKTTLTSLYNCKMLTYLHRESEMVSAEGVPSSQSNKDSDWSDSNIPSCNAAADWSDQDLFTLLDCIQGSVIVKLCMKQSKRMETLLTDASQQLSDAIFTIVHKVLSQNTRNCLWTHAFNRWTEKGEYVLCIKPLLSIQPTPLALTVNPLLDRSSILTAEVVYMLRQCLPFLTSNDCLTFTEIMVARILSLEVNQCLQIDGGIGLLSVLSYLVPMVTKTHQGEAEALFTGVLDQLHTWKEENDDLFLYGRDMENVSGLCIQFNAVACCFIGSLVLSVPHTLSDKHWDFIMCSLSSFVQCLEESNMSSAKSPTMQYFLCSVLDLVTKVTVCLRDNVRLESTKYPENLQTEWTEFFSESIFGTVLPLYLNYYKRLKDSEMSGTDRLVLVALCDAVSNMPKALVEQHNLPPLLIAGDLSPLPDSLQTHLNHMCPMLLATERCVQISAFHLIRSVVASLPEYDKGDNKGLEEGATGGDKQEETTRSPPSNLMKIVDESSSIVEAILGDTPIDSTQPINPLSAEYHYTMAYLLSWKLLLRFFKSAPSELRQEYAGYFQEHSYVDNLMCNIFRLMPNNPGKMFASAYQFDVKDGQSSHGIQLQACSLYNQILVTMPAMARNWWKNQDRKTAAFVDGFTTKYVSQLLCTAEVQSVQKTDVQVENMKIKSRPMTREVIAVYELEEVSIEMVISLPQNYPLGSICVISEKRVGVTGPQWEKWLLQLNIFLQHQNGNIMDGLRLWKNNIDKRFEGVDECMICFYVLHGTNFQLPRITCRTCKKKFHSACLYKWFNTSHNCTCPLCRNVF